VAVAVGWVAVVATYIVGVSLSVRFCLWLSLGGPLSVVATIPIAAVPVRDIVGLSLDGGQSEDGSSKQLHFVVESK